MEQLQYGELLHQVVCRLRAMGTSTPKTVASLKNVIRQQTKTVVTVADPMRVLEMVNEKSREEVDMAHYASVIQGFTPQPFPVLGDLCKHISKQMKKECAPMIWVTKNHRKWDETYAGLKQAARYGYPFTVGTEESLHKKYLLDDHLSKTCTLQDDDIKYVVKNLQSSGYMDILGDTDNVDSKIVFRLPNSFMHRVLGVALHDIPDILVNLFEKYNPDDDTGLAMDTDSKILAKQGLCAFINKKLDSIRKRVFVDSEDELHFEGQECFDLSDVDCPVRGFIPYAKYLKMHMRCSFLGDDGRVEISKKSRQNEHAVRIDDTSYFSPRRISESNFAKEALTPKWKKQIIGNSTKDANDCNKNSLHSNTMEHINSSVSINTANVSRSVTSNEHTTTDNRLEVYEAYKPMDNEFFSSIRPDLVQRNRTFNNNERDLLSDIHSTFQLKGKGGISSIITPKIVQDCDLQIKERSTTCKADQFAIFKEKIFEIFANACFSENGVKETLKETAKYYPKDFITSAKNEIYDALNWERFHANVCTEGLAVLYALGKMKSVPSTLGEFLKHLGGQLQCQYVIHPKDLRLGKLEDVEKGDFYAEDGDASDTFIHVGVSGRVDQVFLTPERLVQLRMKAHQNGYQNKVTLSGSKSKRDKFKKIQKYYWKRSRAMKRNAVLWFQKFYKRAHKQALRSSTVVVLANASDRQMSCKKMHAFLKKHEQRSKSSFDIAELLDREMLSKRQAVGWEALHNEISEELKRREEEHSDMEAETYNSLDQPKIDVDDSKWPPRQRGPEVLRECEALREGIMKSCIQRRPQDPNPILLLLVSCGIVKVKGEIAFSFSTIESLSACGVEYDLSEHMFQKCQNMAQATKESVELSFLKHNIGISGKELLKRGENLERFVDSLSRSPSRKRKCPV